MAASSEVLKPTSKLSSFLTEKFFKSLSSAPALSFAPQPGFFAAFNKSKSSLISEQLISASVMQYYIILTYGQDKKKSY